MVRPFDTIDHTTNYRVPTLDMQIRKSSRVLRPPERRTFKSVRWERWVRVVTMDSRYLFIVSLGSVTPYRVCTYSYWFYSFVFVYWSLLDTIKSLDFSKSKHKTFSDYVLT